MSFVLTLCSGCASFNVGTEFSSEALSNSNNGVAFISLKEKCAEDNLRLQFRIRNVGSHQIYDVGYSMVDMLFIEPGIYYIDYIKLITYASNNVETIRDLPGGGLDSNGVVKYGAFEVVANQVYFIGDIIYSEESQEFVQKLDRTLIDIQLKDKEYKVLLENMKPGKFYKAGSIIYRDKNDNYKISDKKAIK
jgi:hypothetical protein